MAGRFCASNVRRMSSPEIPCGLGVEVGKLHAMDKNTHKSPIRIRRGFIFEIIPG